MSCRRRRRSRHPSPRRRRPSGSRASSASTPTPSRQFTAAVCRALGTPDDIAADVATVLVAADRRGIASHGTARLPSYVALVDAGVVDAAARPVIDAGRGAFVRFDAGNGWGHHAGRVAIDWAIETARTTGIALASARNANHYGIAGWYALRAAAAGMIGMSMTNTTGFGRADPVERQGLIGTNPIAIAAPAGHRPAFSLDMATSTVPARQARGRRAPGQADPARMGDRPRRSSRRPTPRRRSTAPSCRSAASRRPPVTRDTAWRSRSTS